MSLTYTQDMNAVYFPGHPADPDFPLARFLPPLESGSVAHALAAYSAIGDLVLDPFGSSPQLAIEAAKEDRAVLVAASNPVQAFLIETLAAPFSGDLLRSALGYLASLPKNNTRLEPFLLDLYRTRCLHCGREVSAEYFVWDRDQNQLVTKAYTCEGCKFAGEVMASEEDQLRADEFADTGLQRSLALDRIVSAGDPDRSGAEDALEAYPPRALYALVTAMNKVDQVPPEKMIRPAVEALLLSAFDAGSKLWGYPESRSRPRQLAASPQYRENNLWRALEQAVRQWSWPSAPNPVVPWEPGMSFKPGTITIFPGPIRDLVGHMSSDSVSMVMTVPPRPNQAYWTLTALWAAWLWGKQRARSTRSALRRRRYDWNWHADALHHVSCPVVDWLPEGRSVLAFLPEAEPGYIAATLTALAGCRCRHEGAALRMEDQQALLHWRTGDQLSPLLPLKKIAENAVESVLKERGEPCGYPILHGYTWSAMAQSGAMAEVWLEGDDQPLAPGLDALHAALDSSSIRCLKEGTERERHTYWLSDPPDDSFPLMDRIEETVLAILRACHLITEIDLEVKACSLLPGVLTPGRRMVASCLHSYAEEEDGVWRLRPEDEEGTRQEDSRDICRRIRALGERLDYVVEEGDGEIVWVSNRESRHFLVQTSAFLGRFLGRMGEASPYLVVPGGRARLIMEKLRSDPRAKAESRVLKFRHIRRLDEEGLISRDSFEARVSIDPPANQDPQLPLL